ncbi:hypothetical protein BD626DRAFT_505998 [Schizophyllum amplum]|uniref:Ribulose-phosphate 3-epimerase n=1 Tax=Schizophyllum amplum TaxID=97359 RepID=A0A550C649_9AGAR|nr:hypothetical protein BD626DRAFT_505998 [Auriculariopsis ampla]
MPRAIISPSVLASDFGQLTAECKAHDQRRRRMAAHGCHGRPFRAQYYPWAPPSCPAVKKGVPDIFMDCHMMVSDPEKWVDDIADAGGALYCFHLEAAPDPLPIVKHIHDRGMKAGLAISPDTPASAITDEMANAVDMLLVMTVYPGRGGQSFIERCVPKVSELRARYPEKDIEVDGGVGPKTIDVCANAGSNVIVAGTAIFGAQEPENVITMLKASVNSAQAKIAAARAVQ